MGQSCMLVVVMVMMVASLALTLSALLTNHWYRASTDNNLNPNITKSYNFHYGLWRLCYDDMPSYISSDDTYSTDGSCVLIYKLLIQKNEGRLDYDTRLRIHLSRTVLGCNVAAAVATLACLLSLTCGSCSSSCGEPVKRPHLYLTASILLLLATMCGIASGVSFIALRDVDNTEPRTSSALALPPALPVYVQQSYAWSFMLHWIGTGLALVDSFLLLCMLKTSYEFVNGGAGMYSPYSTF